MGGEKLLYVILAAAVMLAGGASGYRYFYAPEGVFSDVRRVDDDAATSTSGSSTASAGSSDSADATPRTEQQASTEKAALPKVRKGVGGSRGPGKSKFVSAR